eukprot:1142377-Pelagomonas_calceolata.AAC.11
MPLSEKPIPIIGGLHNTPKHEVHVEDSLFIGQSRPEICTMCAQSGDPGCAPKLSRQSYNQVWGEGKRHRARLDSAYLSM